MGVKEPLVLWLIGDGKPGHENQSLGLAEAMGRIHPCEWHRISLAGAKGFWGGVGQALRVASTLPRPDLIVAAGHATHLPLLVLGWKYRARRVVLMRPSFPLSWFDWCLAPEHDFPDAPSHRRLLLTRGALNRVSAGVAGAAGRLILLGGPSKTHGWDGAAMIGCLKRVTALGGWELTDSRRTPAGFLTEVAAALPGVVIHPHQQTGPDWLPRRLANAGEVWVSEDSISMIYEALSSGARVGVLPVPRLKRESRVLAGLARLMDDGVLSSYDDWCVRGALVQAPQPLREADRCAGLLVRSIVQQAQ